MARNLLDLIESEAGPTLQGRIAQALGISESTVRTALGAAMRATLSALIGLVSRQGGADTLAVAVRDQDPNILGNLGSSLSGANQQATADSGWRLLSSLLGDGAAGGLANAVSGFSGVNRGAASLLGIAAPLVMGVLGREQRAAGGNASRLAERLISQKDSVAAALPSGLTILLAGTGVLDGISDRLSTGTAAAAGAGRAAVAQATGVANDTARRVVPRSSWLPLTFLALLVIAAIVYAVVSRGPSVPDFTVNGVDLGKEVIGIVNSATQTLQGVTDAASAGSALPRLQEVSAKLDGLIGPAGQLSGEAKPLSVTPLLLRFPTLKQLIDKVLAIPASAIS